MADCNPSLPYPTDDRKWMWFIAWSLIIFAAGLVLIISGKFISYLSFCKKRTLPFDNDEEEDGELEESWYLDFKEEAGNLISGQTLRGRILAIVSFIFNLAACALYVTESSHAIEHCLSNDDILWKVEIILNGFFIFHFFIRFLAANDKLQFWVADPLTLVDILTIPTVFVSIVVDRHWLGLRFLRLIHMVKLSEILQFLNVVGGGQTVEIFYMCGQFLAVWLLSAGMVHLLENTGDFWQPINYENNRTINFFECTYFLLVTMSTIGYGDYYCVTYLGRFFAMLFIGVGLGLFASYIPAIQEYLTSHTKYHLNFKATAGKRHVVVCGHITKGSVSTFLRDFLHADRDDISTNVVFLSPALPDVSMQAILKQHETRAFYYIGTIYSTIDCTRMKLRHADAVIVLCNKKSPNPEEEDSANISRVISVKNYHERCRCIVQLILTTSKPNLLNCPQWRREFNDDIVCINELKLGFIAQSCNAPGFSTLIANLFSMRSDTASEQIPENEQWKIAYMIGASNEVYSAPLSNSFIGMTFPQAVEVCFEKLHLLLFAIEIKDSENRRILAINPTDRKLKLSKSAKGFFLSQTQTDATRASKYCVFCHKTLIDPSHMTKCKCRNQLQSNTLVFDTSLNEDLQWLEGVINDSKAPRSRLIDDYYPNGDKPKFDQTGTFFWCESRPYQTAKLTLKEAASEQFTKHVVILVLSSEESKATIELSQLVLPLRASNSLPSSLKKVVILGNGDVLLKEWKYLENFPNVDIVPGSPYNREDLRAVNVDTADMVILLSPGHSSANVEHQALSDKEVILVTLNLKAMKFDRSKLFIDNEANKALSEKGTNDAGNKTPRGQSRISRSATRISNVTVKTVTQRPDSNATVKTVTQRPDSNVTVLSNTFDGKTQIANKENWMTAAIPMITELLYDSNAMYLDQDDMNIYDDDDIFLTQPYACGSAFTVSVLDSLVSATYFNADVLTLVRKLVTGSVGSDLEELFSEGTQPKGTFETPEIAAVRHRCRVRQLALSEGLLADFGECGLFGDLFLYALRTYNIICLGLYRFRDSQRATPESSKRYVITFPSFNFVLSPTDQVFVLQRFESANKRKKRMLRKSSIY